MNIRQYTVSPQNAPTLKRYSSKLQVSILMKFGSQKYRIKFVCFSFHVGLLFINFSSFKPDTEHNANFDAVSSKRGNYNAIQ